MLQDPVSAWAELIKRCRLPDGLTGLLIAVEVAAITSTLSALINWVGSFVINDLYRPLDPHATPQREIWVSRVTTLILFLSASAVAVLFVKRWSLVLFINSRWSSFSCRFHSSGFSGGASTCGANWRRWSSACLVHSRLFGLDFQNPARYHRCGRAWVCCSA